MKSYQKMKQKNLSIVLMENVQRFILKSFEFLLISKEDFWKVVNKYRFKNFK